MVNTATIINICKFHLAMATFQCLSIIALVFSSFLNRKFVLGSVEMAHHVVDMKSLEPASTCSASAKGPAGRVHGLQITHRYGPCSPLSRKNSSPHPSQILINDQSRVRSINSLTFNKNPTKPTKKLTLFNHDIGGGNFVVTVGFGTPKRDFTLIFDTGSDVTWIKCQPCPHQNCHSAKDPIYNPSISSTFSNSTCDRSCDYFMKYNDQSYSKGYYVRDTLTLTPSNVFPNFVFGCGQENSPNGFGSASGLLAVGRGGPHSFISQTFEKLTEIFCYCLPALDSSDGYLLFGKEALETCQSNKFTPLSSVPNNPAYFVKLIGITIGKLRLDVSSLASPFPATILDSGTVITRLHRLVYAALRSAFQKSMSQYPRAPEFELLDTCYNLKEHKNVTVPSMVLHFANSVDVNLDPLAVISRRSDSQVCLAFAANENESDLNIIGNHQQLNLNVFHDIQNRKVAFGVGGCGK